MLSQNRFICNPSLCCWVKTRLGAKTNKTSNRLQQTVVLCNLCGTEPPFCAVPTSPVPVMWPQDQCQYVATCANQCNLLESISTINFTISVLVCWQFCQWFLWFLWVTIQQVNKSSIMSDEEMSEDYPDFDRIKSSPSTSPLSLPSRENSVILEARDVHQLGKLPCITILIYLCVWIIKTEWVTVKTEWVTGVISFLLIGQYFIE